MRILLVLLVGCATTASTVRSPDGQPLPTTARLDADTGGTRVQCPALGTFWIVEPPPPFVAGVRVGTTRVAVTDGPAMCARIRAASL